MKIKAILKDNFTKRDTYGNVYHVATITNPDTGKGFRVSTPSLGNVEHILFELFPDWRASGEYPFYRSEECTGSARMSSLPPVDKYANECHPDDAWRELLASIGYAVK